MTEFLSMRYHEVSYIGITLKELLSIMTTPKKPKKNPTFGNGDKRRATGQCRTQAQKNASNRRKKK